MNIVDIKDIEDCFDGSFIKEILFDEVITKEFIFYLGNNEILKYYDNFSRPFFKIVKPHFYEIKGVEGNQTIRIILKNDHEKSLNELKKLILQYNHKKI